MIPWKKLCFLILLTTAVSLRANEGTPQGEINLPWSEFEKLTRLDKDTVSLTWEEFQRLVQQTGAETPAFQTQNGRVVLSRAEFKKLLDTLRPPAGVGARTFLTKAVYTGRVDRKGAVIRAQILAHVLAEGPFSPVRVPLFPATTAFEDILLDGRPALVETENGQTVITLAKSGEQEITATFSVAATLDKEPYRLSFVVPETPITRLDIVLDAPRLDARVEGASQLKTTATDGGTRVQAHLPQTRNVSLAWNAVEPEQNRGPAKVYATVHSLISVQDDVVRILGQIDLDVLQNTINNLSVRLPEGYTLLEVTGDAVGEWKKRGEDARTVFVPFDYARKGKFGLSLRLEHPFKEGVVPFDGFQVLGALRESGDLLVESGTTGEIRVTQSAGLIRLDGREVPQALKNLASQTFLDAYKYIRPPLRLDLDIQRHEEMAVVSSVVDSANAVTLLLKDGKCVTHVTYAVKNTAKQFMELQLPAGADVWSAFVEGRPVKPSKGKKGAVLIPLQRSKLEGQNLVAFDVEVMYFRSLEKNTLGGRNSLETPRTDLKISQLLWSVYFPTDKDYLYFGGNVDKEKDADGWRPLTNVALGQRRVLNNLGGVVASTEWSNSGGRGSRSGRKEKARQSVQYAMKSDFDESQGVNEDAFAQQVEREVQFFSNMNQPTNFSNPVDGKAGLAPIRIKVPNSGQIVRFSKVLIQENEPVDLTAVGLSHGVTILLKLLFLLGLLYGGYKQRHRLEAVRAWANKNPRTLERLRSAPVLMATFFLLSLFLSFVSSLWALISLLGGFVFAGRWAWTTFVNKRDRPS